MNYIATVYGLKPTDPELIYRGEMLKAYSEEDFFKAHISKVVWYGSGQEQLE